jgi:hypothetical protein
VRTFLDADAEAPALRMSIFKIKIVPAGGTSAANY